MGAGGPVAGTPDAVKGGLCLDAGALVAIDRAPPRVVNRSSAFHSEPLAAIDGSATD